ncbi:unnamed protein product, partial [Mesorhabditis spiculigera]
MSDVSPEEAERRYNFGFSVPEEEKLYKINALFKGLTTYRLTQGCYYALKTSSTSSSAVQLYDKRLKNVMALLRIDWAHKPGGYCHINLNPKPAGLKRDPHLWVPYGTPWVSKRVADAAKTLNDWLPLITTSIMAYYTARAIQKDYEDGTYENTATYAARTAGTYTGAAFGGKAGSIAGSAVLPGVGTAVGGLVGSLAGAWYGDDVVAQCAADPEFKKKAGETIGSVYTGVAQTAGPAMTSIYNGAGDLASGCTATVGSVAGKAAQYAADSNLPEKAGAAYTAVTQSTGQAIGAIYNGIGQNAGPAASSIYHGAGNLASSCSAAVGSVAGQAAQYTGVAQNAGQTIGSFYLYTSMDPTFLLPHDLLRALSAFDSFFASEFSMRTRPKATSTLQIFRVGGKRYGTEMLRIGHSGGPRDDAFLWLLDIDTGNPRVRSVSIPKGSPSVAAFIGSYGRFLYRWSLQVSHCLAIYGLATAILKDFEVCDGHTAAYARRLVALYVFPGIAAKAMAWLGTGVMPVLGTSAYGLTGALVSGLLVHVAFSGGVHHPDELCGIGPGAYLCIWIFTKIGSSIGEYFFPRFGRICFGTFGLMAISAAAKQNGIMLTR